MVAFNSEEARRILREMTQDAVAAGTYGESSPDDQNLAKHLASRHADGMALARPLADNQDAHEHEHDGPGTIRNHDRDDLSWSGEQVEQIVAEMVEMDPDFSCPEMVLMDPNAHPVHIDIALINLGVRDRGERWAKCANCGRPYQLTPAWSSETVCSDGCTEAYIAYLNNPEL
jgi:hypothetical protein